MTRCNTCGHDKYNPHKRIVDGHITEMCVDRIHDGTHAVPSGASYFLTRAIKSFKKAGLKRP